MIRVGKRGDCLRSCDMVRNGRAETLPVTVVILHWKRAQNIRAIVLSLRGSVDEILIVACEGSDRLEEIDGARIVRWPKNTLYARFSVAAMARNDCVFLHDDDLWLFPEVQDKLYSNWESEQRILHGFYGRRPGTALQYADPIVNADAEVEIVLTRIVALSRELALQTIAVLEHFQNIQENSEPHGNGEDIILSFVAMSASGRLNRVYATRNRVVELRAPHAISRRKGHYEHRRRVLDACIEWLGGRDGCIDEYEGNTL